MNGRLSLKVAALIAAMGMVTLASLPASASTLLGYFDGNDCAGVFGTPPDCVATFVDPVSEDVLLEPTPLIVKIDYNDNGSTTPTFGDFSSIDGSEFDIDFNANDAGGSWTYTPGAGDPVVTAFVIKDGNGFWLFASSGTTGSWAANQQQGGSGISHITFYDGGGGPPFEIPEPAALGLLGLGLASMALIRRRRK